MDNEKKRNKENKRLLPSVFVGIVVTIIIVLLMIVALRCLIKSNELSERLEVLTEEFEELEYENQRLKNELAKELDDDLIRDIAEDQLGLEDPNSEYYYIN